MIINAVCETASQAGALRKLAGIERIYSPENTLPYILREKDGDKVEGMLESPYVLARSLDGLGYLRSEGYKGEIVADHSLYSFNKCSADAIRGLGAVTLTAPLELSCHELKSRGMEDTELMIYGRVPMMISASCVYRDSHDDVCPGPGSAKDGMRTMMLGDRMNTDFPVVCYCRYCYNVIFNSVPLSLHKEIDRVLSLAPASLRLYFTTEDAGETYNIARYFMDLVSGKAGGEPPFTGFTKGHFVKGVQ